MEITINFNRKGERIAQHTYKTDTIPHVGHTLDLEWLNRDLDVLEQYAVVTKVIFTPSNLFKRKVRELRLPTIECEIIEEP